MVLCVNCVVQGCIVCTGKRGVKGGRSPRSKEQALGVHGAEAQSSLIGFLRNILVIICSSSRTGLQRGTGVTPAPLPFLGCQRILGEHRSRSFQNKLNAVYAPCVLSRSSCAPCTGAQRHYGRVPGHRGKRRACWLRQHTHSWRCLLAVCSRPQSRPQCARLCSLKCAWQGALLARAALAHPTALDARCTPPAPAPASTDLMANHTSNFRKYSEATMAAWPCVCSAHPLCTRSRAALTSEAPCRSTVSARELRTLHTAPRMSLRPNHFPNITGVRSGRWGARLRGSCSALG